MISPLSIKHSDLSARLRQAFWIWPDSPNWDIHNSYALFRNSFVLSQLPSRAPLFITADQSYQLFINGRFVCRGPARGFQSHWPYDETDVHPYLKKGRNTMAIRAYNPGFSNFQYLTQGYAGLLVAASWGKTEINSNADWKSIRQSSVSRDTVPTSLQLFSQEHIDLRLESGDWTAPDFDDSPWVAPSLTRWNSAPWFELEPRSIPMLTEREVSPVALIGVSEGVSATGYESVRDVVALRYKEDRSHQASKLRFDPLAITSTGKGKFRSYLFDFGKTVVGNLTFEIDGARGGEIIDTYHTETIDPATLTPDLTIPTHCRMAFGDRLICRSGKFTHHFYHPYGFRYLCVTVREVESDFALQLHLNWMGYPLERKGIFESSDTDLKNIWETCAWTQQCCSLDAYVDTPWREQTQWWGDARVQAWNTFHLAGDARLFRRGIAQIAGQTTPDGVTYGHAPTMAHSCILPDFTLIWMLTIWDYYWQTGSTEPLLTHHATLQNALTYFRAHSDPRTGLVIHDERYWLFLDWNNLFKDGTPTVYNLWLLIALDKLALLYRKAKQPHEAIRLEKWARKIRAALARLIDKDGLLRDGIDRKGRIVPGTSIHSQTLALLANLDGINAESILDRILLPYIRGEDQPASPPSAYWITYVFTALIGRGFGQDVVAFIKKSWLPMVEHGTTWESFTPVRGNGSFSHAWSAHPLYHLMQTIGGIRQAGPAWSEVTFQPVFHGTHGKTAIPSPRGVISSEWRIRRGKIDVKLHLPTGVKARVKLPGVRPKIVPASAKWTLEHA
jgi:alpha-L-rhamnosidase